jgi:hypothetical protein
MVVSPDLEEWMNPRTKFLRTFAMIGAIGVGIAACSDNIVNVPDPVEPRTISAAPSSMTLGVGQTRQIVVSVTGVAAGATFASDNANVATVSSTGVVTGVGPGSATITVTSTADAALATAVDVNVTAPDLPDTGEAEVVLQSITVGQTINPVNPANVAGIIDVTASVERGSATALEFWVGDTQIEGCRQVFGASGAASAGAITAPNLQLTAQSNVVCTINTADFNIVGGQGVPVFENQNYNIRVRLVENGNVLDQATSGALTFNNQDFVVTTLSTPNNAINPQTGLRWDGGAVTVTAVPVIFTGAPIASVTFNYGGNTRTVTTPGESGFVATYALTGANNIGGITDPAFNINTTTVRTNGQPGPSGTSNQWLPAGVTAFRLDNQAPAGGTFELTEQTLNPAAGTALTLCCSNNWVGANYSFAAGKTGHSDAGVGIEEITFHVGAATQTNAQIAALPPITTGAQLDETAVNNALRAVAVVRDHLGNSTTVALSTNATNPQGVAAGATLGVDQTAPTLTFTGGSVANQAIFNQATGVPAASFQVQATDAATGGAAPSGFGTNHVLARVFRWFPGLNVLQQCRPPGAFSLANVALGCRLSGSIGTTAVETTDGYFVYQATAVDQAGNLSHPVTEPISRIVLNDQTDPSASNIAIPSTLTGGAATSFSATVTDNLNLWRGDYRFDFGGVELLPFTDRQTFNSRWVTSQAGLVTEATANVTVNFIRSLETTDGGNAPSTVLQPATAVNLLVEDAAGNFFLRTNPFAGGTVAAGQSFSVAARAVGTFQVSGPAAATQVWNQLATAPVPAVPTSVTLTATATGASGTFNNPFTAGVHFYHRAPGGVNELIGTAAAPSVTDDGVTRTWTWTISWTPAGATAQNPASVFAVGVHSSGDALRSNDNNNIEIVHGTL